MTTFNDIINNNEFKAFIGSIILISCIVCLWICIYKYAMCQEKLKKNNKIYDVCNNRNEMINLHV